MRPNLELKIARASAALSNQSTFAKSNESQNSENLRSTEEETSRESTNGTAECSLQRAASSLQKITKK
jgi:hypothetical protein